MKRKMMKKSDGFQFSTNRRGESYYQSPVFEKFLGSECSKSKIIVKINDYRCQSYCHITRQDKGGQKSSSITLRPDELYNILDNSELIIQNMQACDSAIEKHYNVVAGSMEENIQYEPIPKSQRNMEMEEALKKSKEEKALYEEFLQNREKILKFKNKDNNEEEEEEEEEEENEEEEEEEEEEDQKVPTKKLKK